MAGTPSRRVATDSVQRVNRRLMTILLPLAAASLTAGCTTFSDADAVARVGDTELSADQLDDLLAEQQFPEEARSDLTLVRPVISGWIEETAIENGLFSPELIEAIPDAELLALYDQGIATAGVTCVGLMVAETPEAGDAAADRLRDGEAFADVFADVNLDPDLAVGRRRSRMLRSRSVRGRRATAAGGRRTVQRERGESVHVRSHGQCRRHRCRTRHRPPQRRRDPECRRRHRCSS